MKKSYFFICIILIALITFIVFSPSIKNQFLNWDDDHYIYNNQYIKSFTSANLTKILGVYIYWMPLTWLSHAIDYQIFGLNPAGHHTINIILHILNAILIFTLFLILLKNLKIIHKYPPWIIISSTFFMTLIWAIHPLRVESVVWASQRKAVLSSFFILLTLIIYLLSKKAKSIHQKNLFYTIYSIFFVFALASKPIAVTLPFIMIIIDYFLFTKRKKLFSFLESQTTKIPLIFLSIIISFLTLYGQNQMLAQISLKTINFKLRLINIITNIPFYLQKTIFPINLSTYYPIYDFKWKNPTIIFSLLTIILISIISYWIYKKYKNSYFLTAWLCYLIYISPVLGLIQVGNQIKADRWSYLSTLGIYFLFGSFLIKFLNYINHQYQAPKLHFIKTSLFFSVHITLILIILNLSFLTIPQIKIWKNSKTFWETLILQHPNAFEGAYTNLASVYAKEKKFKKAEQYYQKGLKFNPDNVVIQNNLGILYQDLKKYNKAENWYALAIATEPSNPYPYNNLGSLYFDMKNYEKSAIYFEKALVLKPDYITAQNNLLKSYLLIIIKAQKTGQNKKLSNFIKKTQNFLKTHPKTIYRISKYTQK